MPLVFEDEEAGGIEGLLLQASQGAVRLLVPPLFWYEVGNVLRQAAVRKRLSDDEAETALYRVTELPISTDGDLSPVIALRIGRFAARHALTMYDAAYFELADRHNASLFTRDKALLGISHECPWIRSVVE